MGYPAKTNSTDSLFENLPARVDKIHIDGLQRTKDDFVIETCKEIFEIKTFQELLEKTVETKLNLDKLGCFKKISVVIDTSSGLKSTPDYGYDVTFNVVELNRITGRINTHIENNQGSIGFMLQSPNLIGRGESLCSELKYSSNKMQNFRTSFIKPLLFNNGTISSSVFKMDSENMASGYKLTESGFQLALSLLYGGLINHNIEYEGVIRNASVLNRNVAFIIREVSGYSLKSSIKSNLSYDTRNSYIFPTSGNLVKLKSEYAGLGGDIGFFKNELFSQVNLPILSDITLQGSFGAGLLVNTFNEQYYSIIDRFFLGGPLTLRGYHFNSVGPRTDGYATGGSLYWISALHLYTPLLHRPKEGSFGDSFRIHLFCNAGNLIHPQSDSYNNYFEVFSKTVRLTYGIGLVYRLGQIARIELNYCIPVYYQSDDKLIDRVQLGLGIEFV